MTNYNIGIGIVTMWASITYILVSKLDTSSSTGFVLLLLIIVTLFLLYMESSKINS